LGGNVVVNAIAGQTASITGNVGDGSSLTLRSDQSLSASEPNTSRKFTVNGGVGNDSDIIISAQINHGSLIKAGNGTMTISFDNSGGYEGTTTVNDGILRITNNNALGLADGTVAKGTLVNGNNSNSVTTNGTLQMVGGIKVSSEALTLNGDGFLQS